MKSFHDKESIFYIGYIGGDDCDEYLLVASKGLSEETIKQRIKSGEIKTGESDTDDDMMSFNEIEFIESKRWTIVKLLTYG